MTSMLTLSQKEMLHLHGCLLLQYQHPKQAITLLKALLVAAPDFLPAQYTMALASLDANECETCIEWCTSLLSNDNEEKKDALYLCMSRAHWRMGNADKAKLAYEEYLQFCSKHKKPRKQRLPTLKQMDET